MSLAEQLGVPSTRPLVLGHRGVRGAAPENTMAAFEEAARQGADGFELDARACATGELVVLHDRTLAAVTGGADRRAAEATAWSELRRADVGGGERPPLLAQALAFARERGLVVNVELKHDVPDRRVVVAAAARLLRSWDRAHRLLVSSFDPWMLAGMAALAPRTPRAQLVHRARFSALHAAAAWPVGALAVHLERTLVSAAAVRRLRRAGLAAGAWTVNAPREAIDLAAVGVRILISDAPGVVLAALAAR
jgi:glycerophosphoryl diester phosphodiesterase